MNAITVVFHKVHSGSIGRLGRKRTAGEMKMVSGEFTQGPHVHKIERYLILLLFHHILAGWRFLC